MGSDIFFVLVELEVFHTCHSILRVRYFSLSFRGGAKGARKVNRPEGFSCCSGGRAEVRGWCSLRAYYPTWAFPSLTHIGLSQNVFNTYIYIYIFKEFAFGFPFTTAKGGLEDKHRCTCCSLCFGGGGGGWRASRLNEPFSKGWLFLVSLQFLIPGFSRGHSNSHLLHLSYR